MEDTVRRDIISVLARCIHTLEGILDASVIKRLSNETIHNASIFQDEDSISIAILLYSLSKIVDRLAGSMTYKETTKWMKSAKWALEKDDEREYRRCIQNIFSLMHQLDSKYRTHIQEVMAQASVRKGSKLYAHGVSMARTAQILGVSLWELHDYVSSTTITDGDVDISSVRQRLEFAMKLFS